jgi:hypothetical protein
MRPGSAVIWEVGGLFNVFYYMLNNEGSAATTANLAVVHTGVTGTKILKAAVGDAGKALFAGVAQAAVTAARYGLFLRRGVGSYVADATVAVGDQLILGSTTAGRLKVKSAATEYVVAQALETASAGNTKICEFVG